MKQPGKFLTAEWRSLAMLNYQVDAAILKPHVPAGTELDSFDGVFYISMVGFMFQRTRVLGAPIPGHQDFEEVNLRFYVRRRHQDAVARSPGPTPAGSPTNAPAPAGPSPVVTPKP